MFDEDLSAIADAGQLRRIKRAIERVEAARTFQQIPNLKRLDAKGKYYRIRVGDYRVVFKIADTEVFILGIRHRKDVCGAMVERI